MFIRSKELQLSKHGRAELYCHYAVSFVWAAKLEDYDIDGRFYIDIPLSILNIIPVNVHLFRKSQNSQNRRLYLHRKYRSDLPKVKIWQHYTTCIFLYVWAAPNVFSHFYTPTLAMFRKMNDRFRLSQNFEKRDFIMFLLTVFRVSKPPNLTYSNCHFIKDFEENYLVLPFLCRLSRIYLMLV